MPYMVLCVIVTNRVAPDHKSGQYEQLLHCPVHRLNTYTSFIAYNVVSDYVMQMKDTSVHVAMCSRFYRGCIYKPFSNDRTPFIYKPAVSRDKLISWQLVNGMTVPN